jgi:2-oxoglutarate/2-oxoacid ferredoxin oxidoreductase subunit alpha
LNTASSKILLKGNEVMCEAAVRAGCKFFAGYPITPQNEVPEYMSWRLPQAGGVFVQAESEIAAINMVFGAAATGFRCMTSSSSPGISLKQEGISYIAAAELPCVITNVQRGGPGLGNIRAAQGDYFQAVKGGGHGDYHLIVLAPATMPELYSLTMNAFDYADHYLNPVMILMDGILGQMVEPVEPVEYRPLFEPAPKNYILDGCQGRKPRIIKTLHLQPAESLVEVNRRLVAKYHRISGELKLHEEFHTEGARLIVSAYGITAQIAKGAVLQARAKGLKVGLIRPITLWPFPEVPYIKAAETVDKFLVVEMSNGQMVEDVRLAQQCRRPVEFFGIGGGWYPTIEELLGKIESVYSAGTGQSSKRTR